MSDNSKTAGRALIAALLLCAFIGTVRAQESSAPPAAMDAAVASAAERDRQDDEARHLAERRQQMIDDCEQNHGGEVDCVRETDTELRAEGMRLGAHVIHLRPAAR
jgi:hypothetical protein